MQPLPSLAQGGNDKHSHQRDPHRGNHPNNPFHEPVDPLLDPPQLGLDLPAEPVNIILGGNLRVQRVKHGGPQLLVAVDLRHQEAGEPAPPLSISLKLPDKLLSHTQPRANPAARQGRPGER